MNPAAAVLAMPRIPRDGPRPAADPALVYLLGRLGPDDAAAPPAALAFDAEQWRRLARLSERHRVAPQLAPDVLAAGGVPAEVADYFARIRRDAELVRRTSILAQAAICDACRRRGIPLILLKGLGAAERFYADPAGYSSRDVDLLVRPADLAGVEEILAGQGYRSCRPEYYRREHFHTVWLHGKRSVGGCVEVHWNVTLPRHSVSFPVAEWWDRGPRVELAAGSVQVPPVADEVVYLAWHGLVHGTMRLRELSLWVRACGRALEGHAAGELVARAAAARAEGFLYRAAALALSLWPMAGLREIAGEDGLLAEPGGAWRRIAGAAFAPGVVIEAGSQAWWPLLELGFWSMLPAGAGGLGRCWHQAIVNRLDADPPTGFCSHLAKTTRYNLEFWLAWLSALALRSRANALHARFGRSSRG